MTDNQSTPQPAETPEGKRAARSEDRRLYVLDADWSIAVNRGSVSVYCHSQNVGEAFYHLIVDGEVFVRNGTEKLCVNCALRLGVITTDRLAWQHRTGTQMSRL